MRKTISLLFVPVLALTGGLTGSFVSAQDCDFVTGGGFIFPDAVKKANFGVAGGCKKGSLWGHLEYLDHGSLLAPATTPPPFKVHGTEVTGYFSPVEDSPIREIQGTARTNDPAHSEVTYCVQVADNGKGGSLDIFEIQLSDESGIFYTAGPQPLGGGNIKLHKHNPSNTGDFSTGSCLVTACALPGESCVNDTDCCGAEFGNTCSGGVCTATE
jgi:hypothetical protein